eukprot:c21441_g1_i2 orf=1-270(-)
MDNIKFLQLVTWDSFLFGNRLHLFMSGYLQKHILPFARAICLLEMCLAKNFHDKYCSLILVKGRMYILHISFFIGSLLCRSVLSSGLKYH